MIVTIDGPAGAGKSTVAKSLADKLRFRFLDTGATSDPGDDIWTAKDCEKFQVTVTCSVQAMALDADGIMWAAIAGRDFVLPDDVKRMAPAVLIHRLMIAPQAQLRGQQLDELVAGIIERVPVPVEG